MGEQDSDYKSSLIDLTKISLAQLTTLDDAAFEKSVRRLLRLCDNSGDRQWDNG